MATRKEGNPNWREKNKGPMSIVWIRDQVCRNRRGELKGKEGWGRKTRANGSHLEGAEAQEGGRSIKSCQRYTRSLRKKGSRKRRKETDQTGSRQNYSQDPGKKENRATKHMAKGRDIRYSKLRSVESKKTETNPLAAQS